MAELVATLDMTKPAGQRLAPQVRAEIEEVAPSTLNDGQVTTAKLGDSAVTEAKIKAGAVTTTKIGTKAVKAANIDDDAVGTDQLADDAVTADKAGIGLVVGYDAAGNPIKFRLVPMTSAAYAALASKDPNTFYHLTD